MTSIQEDHSKAFFKSSNLLADSALADTVTFSRIGKAARLDNIAKNLESLNLHTSSKTIANPVAVVQDFSHLRFCFGPNPFQTMLSRSSIPALLGILVILAFHGECTAQEWPRFRGPNGSGIGNLSGLPEEIKESDYSWKVLLPGPGHSSPVLWGEKLYLTAIAEGNERLVLCIDPLTGGTLWTWKETVAAHNLHQFNNFASATPTADERAVYLVWGSGERTEALALDHEGNLLWRREWPAFSSDHGFGASPMLCDGVLVVHTDSVKEKSSKVMGLDPASGKTLWELSRPTIEEDRKHLTAYNTPVRVEVAGEPVLVVFQTNDGWRGLDPITGSEYWHWPGAYKLRSVGSLIAAENLVFASVGEGGNGKEGTALRLNADGPPEVAYSLGISDGLSYVTTPLFHEGLLYLWADGGVLTCLDAASGTRLYRERVGGNFFSSPIIADGKILSCSREGELVMVRLGPEFSIVSRSLLGASIQATPAIALNRLFVRTEDSLICIAGK